MRLPVRPQRDAEVERVGEVCIFNRRNERLLQIWKLPLCDRAVCGGGLAGHLQEVRAMACPKLARVGIKPLLSKFAQRVQHGEARDAGFVRLGVNQRRRHERLELPACIPGFANRFDGSGGPAAAKHRQGRKELLLRPAQQLPAPLDRRLKRHVAAIASPALSLSRQQVEALGKRIAHFGRGVRANARCGDLDRQRQTFERTAKLNQGRAIVIGQCKVGARTACAIDEQGEAGRRRGFGRIHGSLRHRKRVDDEYMLARDIEDTT